MDMDDDDVSSQHPAVEARRLDPISRRFRMWIGCLAYAAVVMMGLPFLFTKGGVLGCAILFAVIGCLAAWMIAKIIHRVQGGIAGSAGMPILWALLATGATWASWQVGLWIGASSWFSFDVLMTPFIGWGLAILPVVAYSLSLYWIMTAQTFKRYVMSLIAAAVSGLGMWFWAGWQVWTWYHPS